MERIVNGERIELRGYTPDEIINNTVSPLKNFEESADWRFKKFIDNLTDLDMDHPELEKFVQQAVTKLDSEYKYEFITDETLVRIHDEFLEMWKYYKQNEGRFLNMGANIPESTEEGRAFGAAMGFDVKDKDVDRQLTPTPTKDGEWDKYKAAITPDPKKAKIEKARRERPSKTDYYLGIAKAVSARGTCLRRRFGAIIVKDDRIVSTGYVGAPRGRKNCCDIGTCFRMENNIPSGQRYELCRSVHAEMNAIINASKEELEGGVMYLVGVEPDGTYTPNADCCSMCKRVIINAGIRYVVIGTENGHKRIDVTNWINEDDSLALHEGY